MPTPISVETARDLMDVCESHFQQLVYDGCSEDIACDRTYDTLVCVLDTDQHCFDPRDRLFENNLRTIVQKGKAT